MSKERGVPGVRGEGKPKRAPMEMADFTAVFTQDWSAPLFGTGPMADAATATLFAAFLEQLLMILLDRFFVVLKCGACRDCKAGRRCGQNDTIFAMKGTLDSYSKCADVSLRLGLITSAFRKNVQLVGEVRNRFAHYPGLITFDDKWIKHAVSQLAQPKTPYPADAPPNTLPSITDAQGDKLIDHLKGLSTKQRFVSIAVSMCVTLNNGALKIKKLSPFELYPGEWS
jgi:hypothetical protein